MSFIDKIFKRDATKKSTSDEFAASVEYFEKVPSQVLTRWPFLHPALLSHTAWRAGAVFSILAPTPGDTVLDFGSGNGWASLWLNRCGVRTVSVDVAPNAAKIAREAFDKDPLANNCIDPLFLTYDGSKIDLDDGACDRAFALDALHHVPNLASTLKEIHRVLRDGGKFAFADVGANHSKSAPARFEMKHYGIVERDILFDNVAKLAKDAGFSAVKIYPIPNPGAVVFDPAMAARFARGESSLLPAQPFVDALGASSFMLLEKGAEIIDSRHPSALAYELKATPAKIAIKLGSTAKIDLSVKNTGDTIWLASEKHGRSVKPAARLYDKSGALVSFDFASGSFAKDIHPGEEAAISFELPSPDRAGEWIIEIDFKLGDFWFEGFGNSPARIEAIAS